MRKQLTGEPVAGELHTGFGGRGRQKPFPTPIQLRSCESSHDRKNWLFSGSLAAGARAADIMSLIQTAKMNNIEPLAYLTDVLTRLPTHPNSCLEELLPTRWQPATGVRQ